MDSNAKDAAAENFKKSQGSSMNWFNHETFKSTKEAPKNPFIVVPLPQGEEEINYNPRVRENSAQRNHDRDKATGDWHNYEGNRSYYDKPVPKIGQGDTPREIMNKLCKDNDVLSQHAPKAVPISVKVKESSSSAWYKQNQENAAVFRAPRTHSESRKVMIKNNQSEIFTDPPKSVLNENKYANRCPTFDSRNNQLRNIQGNDMSNILSMGGSDGHANKNILPHYGIKGETLRQYKQQGERGTMGESVVKRENIQIYREEYIPKVRLDGEEILERSTQGKAMKSILDNEREIYEEREFRDVSPVGRPIYESKRISEEQKRGSMNQYIGNEAESTTKSYQDKLQPRSGVNDEIREIVSHQSQEQLKDILQTEGKLGGKDTTRNVYRSLRNKEGYRNFMATRGDGISSILPHTNNLKVSSVIGSMNRLPAVRLRYGADNIKAKHSGSVMANILAQKT